MEWESEWEGRSRRVQRESEWEGRRRRVEWESEQEGWSRRVRGGGVGVQFVTRITGPSKVFGCNYGLLCTCSCVWEDWYLRKECIYALKQTMLQIIYILRNS